MVYEAFIYFRSYSNSRFFTLAATEGSPFEKLVRTGHEIKPEDIAEYLSNMDFFRK